MKKKKKRLRWFKRLVIWLVLLAAAAVAVKFILLPKLEAEATITYNSYAARIGTISNSLSFSGSISVQNNETITADSAATVRQIYVAEGDKVTRGQRLMRLSSGDTLKASFDGEVNKISVQVGDEVNANASLIQIVDFENMQVSMRVDEYSISDLKVGQECRITVTALGKTFDSKISHINRISSGGGNTAYYTVTAELVVTSNVLPGMAATVTIPQEEAVDKVILNKSALSFARDNSAYVLMYDDQQVLQQVPVTVGLDNDNYVEITSGLKAGDTVYAEVKTNAQSSGLLTTLFSSFGGGQNNNRSNPGGFQNNRQNNRNNGGFGGMMPGGR
nr:efflux RND transporter periplasmic adaptor subunit [Clostridia bacterium]